MVKTKAGAIAVLIGKAPVVGVFVAGVGVDGEEEDVGTAVKNFLGAVAVVVINVQNGNPLPLLHQPVGRDGHVVEVAKAAKLVGGGMVARWSAEGVHGFLWFGSDEGSSGNGRLHTPICCLPGLGKNGRRCIEAVKPKLAQNGVEMAL